MWVQGNNQHPFATLCLLVWELSAILQMAHFARLSIHAVAVGVTYNLNIKKSMGASSFSLPHEWVWGHVETGTLLFSKEVKPIPWREESSQRLTDSTFRMYHSNEVLGPFELKALEALG